MSFGAISDPPKVVYFGGSDTAATAFSVSPYIRRILSDIP